jgi:hypothetical protein
MALVWYSEYVKYMGVYKSSQWAKNVGSTDGDGDYSCDCDVYNYYDDDDGSKNNDNRNV